MASLQHNKDPITFVPLTRMISSASTSASSFLDVTSPAEWRRASRLHREVMINVGQTDCWTRQRDSTGEGKTYSLRFRVLLNVWPRLSSSLNTNNIRSCRNALRFNPAGQTKISVQGWCDRVPALLSQRSMIPNFSEANEANLPTSEGLDTSQTTPSMFAPWMSTCNAWIALFSRISSRPQITTLSFDSKNFRARANPRPLVPPVMTIPNPSFPGKLCSSHDHQLRTTFQGHIQVLRNHSEMASGAIHRIAKASSSKTFTNFYTSQRISK